VVGNRSLGTELMKVLAADIGEPEKDLIVGANIRRLVEAGQGRTR